MIRKTIPVLVHEDCMDSISVGLAKQEASIAKIAENTTTANVKLDTVIANQGTAQSKLNDIAEDTNTIEGNTTSIKTSSANASTLLNQIDADTSAIRTNSGNIKNNTDSLTSSVGLPADEASANTVIGLLKSIANKF